MSTTKTRTKPATASRPEAGETHAETQQEPGMMAEPQAEHRWLEQLVGEWTFEGEGVMGPDKPPMKWKGTEKVRSLGGLWIMAEGRGDMPGCGPSTSMMTLGYNPQKGRFVGTFIASMMTHMWIYDGELDTTKTVLTLNTEGPNMATPGKMANFRDVIEIKSDDHRTLSSYMQDADGNWRQFMTGHYRRKK